ncbi:MAG: sel1 repeat family protein [Alphaproteobacteria bacterium]|nr:MAG: sel1 repeat family protein [Alphaproteobacteria bacterium]
MIVFLEQMKNTHATRTRNQKTRALVLAVVLGVGAACAGEPDYWTGHAAYGRGDFKAALEILYPLARANDAQAQLLLGKAYASGAGVPRDGAEADRWFAKAVRSGPFEHGRIADLYMDGKGVPKDFRKAMRWYEEGAGDGEPWAMYSLGELYRRGKGVAVDYPRAFGYYTAAIAAGGQYGHAGLAWMYSLGQGRPVDWARAVFHLKAAAQAGSLTADWELGDYYAAADLGGKDLEQAERHYLRSARMGSLLGIYKLARFYGREAGKPYEALKWWRVQMRRGGFAAASEIGLLYLDGLLGEDGKEVMALAWFLVADELGADSVKPPIEDLKKRLGPGQVADAARKAAAIRSDFGL